MTSYKPACQVRCLQLMLLIWAGCATHDLKQSKVAIIGAGIGGSTAAYFLREEVGSSVQLDIFEVNEVGGRTQIWQDGDEVYEMGASIVHEQNQYFRELADSMGLEQVRLGSDGDDVSIWDGQNFVFNQSTWSLVNLYRMISRRAAGLTNLSSVERR